MKTRREIQQEKYDAFCHKWVGRNLQPEAQWTKAYPKISMREDVKVIFGTKWAVDYFTLPVWHAWESERQRREFRKEAKDVGVRYDKKIQDWYYLKNIISS